MFFVAFSFHCCIVLSFFFSCEDSQSTKLYVVKCRVYHSRAKVKVGYCYLQHTYRKEYLNSILLTTAKQDNVTRVNLKKENFLLKKI